MSRILSAISVLMFLTVGFSGCVGEEVSRILNLPAQEQEQGKGWIYGAVSVEGGSGEGAAVILNKTWIEVAAVGGGQYKISNVEPGEYSILAAKGELC
ncbi:MAG: hypothetical protein PHH26_07530, partial [Candidatus Thermoplasmatota archaeon]|nr:hypothetical protein [Candidatus Thermoplasmatota archaeon]